MRVDIHKIHIEGTSFKQICLEANDNGIVVVLSMTTGSADSDVVFMSAPVNAALGEAPAALLGVPPWIALMSGWVLHDDLAYDSTALWMHLSAGVRGRDDRLGRMLAAALAIIGTFSHRDTGSPNHAESYCHQNLPSDQSRALLAAAERRHRPTLASRPNLWIRRGPNFARLRKCLRRSRSEAAPPRPSR